jgi:hypothetical protein
MDRRALRMTQETDELGNVTPDDDGPWWFVPGCDVGGHQRGGDLASPHVPHNYGLPA